MTENQPKRLMLMFTIGPVQSFIEAARKTEDLWMGSYILSYLVATAMDEVQGDGVELIYPAIGSQSPFEFWKNQDFTTPSFPNLFLAIGDGTISQDDLAEYSKKAESAVNTVFQQMTRRVLDKAFSTWRGTYVEELFEKQIPDYFDIYWVITQEKPDQSYGEWYEYTAGSLASIKNCREFKQISELGRKCSLDGTREILHLEEKESVEQAMKWWEDFARRTPRHCRQKEALCAVSLTKRMGMHYLEKHSRFKDQFTDENEGPKFPSTSEVATAAYKERILCSVPAFEIYQDLCRAVKNLKSAIPIVQPLPKIKCPIPNNVDGEWLYEETWSKSYLERYYNIDWESQQGKIQHCEELRNKLVGKLNGEPGKYYAAIALDADNMGEVNRKAENREEHEKNSKQLIDYTKVVRRIVEEEHLGKLTYAGGDDLLALTNIRDLLQILKKLHKHFPDFTSISAGVCIAHNKMPLTNVIAHARRMEKAAKTEGERDAVSIALYKHSGNVSQTIVKWIYNKQKVVHVDIDKDNSFKTMCSYDGLKVIPIGERLVKLLQDDEVSKNFLYSFRDAVAKLIGDEGKLIKGVPPVLVEEEFRRLIERAYKTIGKNLDDSNKQTVQQTVELLHNIVPRSFQYFLGFLEIITFITRESK